MEKQLSINLEHDAENDTWDYDVLRGDEVIYSESGGAKRTAQEALERALEAAKSTI